MASNKISLFVLSLGLLTFGASSCDLIDPYDPGTGGHGGGGNGGGCDTIVVEEPEQMVSAHGTLRLVISDEGHAFFGIEAEGGKKYEPTNLHADQFGDGQNIFFRGYVVKDWGSINNYGELIELTEIEAVQ